MKPYPAVEDLLAPVLRVAMPRAARLAAPGGTGPGVARCHNRAFFFTTPEDCEGLRGHLRERMRTLDWNPVRAGLVADPATDPWSSGAAYARGTAHVLITCHPSSRALSPDPRVRQRQDRTRLPPSAVPRLDARDPRWTTQRAVGSPAFLRRYIPPRGRRRTVPVPPQIQALGG